MACLNSLVSDTGVQTTSMPSWYEDTQKKVASGATDVLNTGTIAPSETVTQKAVDELGGQGPNPYTKSTDALTSIAAGAANPWMTSFETGEVTPDTSTAMGGLFQAQTDYLNQVLPDINATATAPSIGSGGFGSKMNLSAIGKARSQAVADLFKNQMQAALQNEQTGVSAGAGLGNIGNQLTQSGINTATYEQNLPYADLVNKAKILQYLNPDKTTTEQKQLSPLGQDRKSTRLNSSH